MPVSGSVLQGGESTAGPGGNDHSLTSALVASASKLPVDHSHVLKAEMKL